MCLLRYRQRTPSKLQSHTVESQPAQPYEPPKGYAPVILNQNTTSDSAHIFDNLEGKQIWHITAPANVSLEELKELAMDSVLNGEPILEHKGTSYGFSKAEQSEHGACEVLVPQRNGYKAGKLDRFHSKVPC